MHFKADVESKVVQVGDSYTRSALFGGNLWET